MATILLFYKYVTIGNPKAIMKWQRKICQDLGLKGRIFLAHEGINATLGGATKRTEKYKELMDAHPLFGNIDFKESAGDAECFPRLQVTVKKEIVHLGLDAATFKAADGARHVTPEEAHQLMQNAPEDLLLFDNRNDYEAHIGTFKGALIPDVQNFREFPQYVDNNTDKFKDKRVLMFCTGGIRCERASTYLKSKNVAKEVLQIEGGIHRYAEKYPDGFFRGKNYVFDRRIAIKVNDDVLSTCDVCGVTADDYTNCYNVQCNKQYISCADCLKKFGNTCSQQCADLIRTGKVQVRKSFERAIV